MTAQAFDKRVRSLTEELPPLPDFSRFHARFRASDGKDTPEGDIRAAYFLAYDETTASTSPSATAPMEKAIDRARAGLDLVHHPLSAGLSDPGAGPGDLRRILTSCARWT